MDYGKFRYTQQKKQAELRKRQPKNVLKEIKLTPRIEQHDIEIKVRRAKEFLEDNCSVRVSMSFRGRENNYKPQGIKILEQFKIEGYHSTDVRAEGNIISIILGKI